MKLTGPFLVALACRAALLADDIPTGPANPPEKLSAHISAMVRAELPGFKPRTDPPAATPAGSDTVGTRDPDVLELPKITVRERPPPKVESLDLLILSERKRKLARDFKNSFNGLDGLLNGFSIPILSPSMAERGRAYHQQQQLEELNRVAGAIKGDDPKAATGLQNNAGDAQRALDRQNRPSGDK